MEICKKIGMQISKRQDMLAEYQDMLKSLDLKQEAIKNKYEDILVYTIAGRSVLIWGAVKRNDFFLEFANKNNIKTIGYIDSNLNASSFNGYSVWKPEEVNPEQQYIFIGLNNVYCEVLDKLDEWGKIPCKDYLYWAKNDITVTSCNGFYNDFLGNQIIGDVTGFSISLKRLSCLHIGKNCFIDKTVKIILGENSVLEIGDNCRFEHDTTIRVTKNSFAHIGNKCMIRPHTFMVCHNNCKVYISDNVRFGLNFRLACNSRGSILIRKNCIFSADIVLQGFDGHPLYDLQQHCGICKEREYKIEIGEHVWIGKRCNIRYGAKIGAGSVIGMGSFVNKEVPCNVIAAGNPLKIIRENIAWSRTECPSSDDYFDKYDFR